MQLFPASNAFSRLTRALLRNNNHHPRRLLFNRLMTRAISTSKTAMSGTQGILAEAFSASVKPAASSPPGNYHFKPHHAKDGKGFLNPWDSWVDLGPTGIMRGIVDYRSKHGFSGPKTQPAPKVIKPDFPATRTTDSTSLRATWLGHACYYVEFPGGLRVLFDPVFSMRCSPVQFMGPKRYTKMPCDIADIPVVDAVCISHNHYDHTDYNTVLKLLKSHPNAHYFVPLGLKAWFAATGVTNCTELDWWDETDLDVSPADLKTDNGHGALKARLGLLPCQHTSGRGLTDRGMTLWGGWSVESGGKKVYFAGDTGYRAVPQSSDGHDDHGPEYANLPVCPAFKEIGEHRGGFDLGLIPIGAYVPRWIMSPMHVDPTDAVDIFLETKCEKALGMHWGTWVLTDEPVMEPPKLLRAAMKKRGLEETGVFDVLDIGGSRSY